MHDARGVESTQRPGGAFLGQPRAALVLTLVLLAPALSGCIGIDFFLPQKEGSTVPSGDGLVRVWAAAKPGGLGPEFVHYNVSFGFTGHARDPHLSDIVPMDGTHPTVDLLRLSDGKAKMLGQITARPGDYHGFTFTTTGASITREQVVGMSGGEPQKRLVETVLRHRTTAVDVPVTLRAEHVVLSTIITDLYLEIDLERSLIYEDGELRHKTTPFGVTVYVQGKNVGRQTFDGGEDAAGNNGFGPPPGPASSRFKAPWSEPNIYHPDTGQQLYSATAMPSKRMNRAVGLEQDLRFDGSGSMSFVAETGIGRMPIIDWRWEFGDGTTASGPVVLKNYTEGGLHEVFLTVRDDYGLVGENHLTLFVPYTADQAEVVRTDARSGEILIGSATLPLDTLLDTASHSLEFPQDLEDGALYLGAYRVTLDFASGLGSAVSGVTTMQLRASAGHFDAVAQGTSPVVLESAAVPVWRGPLLPWAAPEIDLELELLTGLAVDYTVTVEALYYDNLSRGLDPHPAHLHGTWPFGPIWDHLDWRGRARAPDDA